jgi:hypothetical protein
MRGRSRARHGTNAGRGLPRRATTRANGSGAAISDLTQREDELGGNTLLIVALPQADFAPHLPADGGNAAQTTKKTMISSNC